MDIIIKSFNRPHYLDRCLLSIKKNTINYNSITILDDGTPKKYLDKIKDKYPEVLILTSDQYLQKSTSIENNSFDQDKLNGFSIPTNLWYSSVENTEDYVLVTEDDVWFTQKVDFLELINSIKKNGTVLIKLGWLGNKSDDKFCLINSLDENLDRIVPKKLISGNDFFMNLFMFNKYKFYSLLYKLNLVDNKTKRKYWVLNSILMGLYKKDYWLYIWKDSVNKLDEKIQLKNAAVFYHKNKSNKNLLARTKSELMKTTFKSTSSGVYHDYGLQLDVNRVNKILNEAWLNGEFDSMENYPNDFSDNYIKSFLDKENHPDAQYNEWFKWAEKFRQQYRNLGAEVE